MGLLAGRVGPHGLEKARLALLGLVCGGHGAGASAVTVVFDAARAPPGAEPEAEYRGVRVRYALGGEADDVIEDLVRRDSAPRGLAVVSDDRRLHPAAPPRACLVLR